MRPREEKPKRERLVIYLEEGEGEYVKERARAEGISISGYIRRLLRLTHEQKQSESKQG